MARLTLDQINALMPTNESYLQGMGIQQSVGDDGSPVYYKDGNRVSPGQIQEMLGGSDFGLAGRQALDQNGIVDTSFFSGLSPYLQGKYGNSIQSADDYMKYLYGGQGEKVGNYWVLPQGMDVNQTVNPRYTNDSPDDKLTQMMPYLIAAGAMAGLGGFLPGTESVFGGAGAGAGGTVGGLSASDAALIDAANAGVWGGGGSAGAGLTGSGLAADAAWGVNAAGGVADAGGLAFGDTPWWSNLGNVGMGDPLTAAGIGGGATPVGAGGALAGSSSLGLGLPTQFGSTVGTLGTAANPGIGPATTAAQSGTALSRLLSGNATDADKLQLAGSLGSSLLGAAGSNAQADAYSDVANKYLALGAPYRQKLEASYAPGFSMADQPDFQNALDIGAQAAARATSAKYGNPVDNPGAYAEMQKYISGSLALPQLNTYRSQLGSFGQLGTNVAGTNDTQAAGQTSGTYNSLGFGLGQLTQPQNPYEQAMKGILGNLRLNQPGYL